MIELDSPNCVDMLEKKSSKNFNFFMSKMWFEKKSKKPKLFLNENHSNPIGGFSRHTVKRAEMALFRTGSASLPS